MAEDAPAKTPPRADGADGAATGSKESKPAENAVASASEPVADDVTNSVEEGKKGDAVETADKKGDEKPDDKAAAKEEANGDNSATAADAPKDGAETSTESAAPADKPAPTPAKKKGVAKPARRKSLANLKHRKSEVLDINYEVGQAVLAKMRSFPPWPALILSKELLPEVMVSKPPSGNARALETLGNAAWSTQYPIFYMGTYEYSWIAASDLEPLSEERIKAGAGSRKAKKLVEAFAEASQGFSLDDVKKIQESVMEVDEEEVEAEVEDDEMDVDEEEREVGEDEKLKKKAQSKKRKKSESASDDEDDSEKPAKTPKKTAPKAKATPKSTTKATATATKAKTTKAAANGVKASAKKEKAAPPVAKKKGAAKGKKAATKGKEAAESDSEASEKSSVNPTVNPKTLSPEDQHRYILERRHKLQKAFLNKEGTPPEEKEMSELSGLLTSLQEWAEMPADLIKATKIHKVLRGIMNVAFEIPLEEKYRFKSRCEPLHAKWMETLRSSDKPKEPEKAVEKEDPKPEAKENGVNGEAAKDDGPTVAAEGSKEEPVATKEVVMRDVPPTAESDKEKEKEKDTAVPTTEANEVEASA